MDWITAVATAVAEGKTKSQFAIPDGVYVGDLFFVTDAKHKILMAFAWTGDRWAHEHERFDVQIADATDEPASLKPVTVRIGPK